LGKLGHVVLPYDLRNAYGARRGIDVLAATAWTVHPAR
jgi:bifunctional DNA-binding transcriptional regulator/antitoxin component of YhaV-PrlF toxin-antitoxin module